MAHNEHGMIDDSELPDSPDRKGQTVRLTTAFNKLLRLPGVFVTAVAFEQDRIIVDVVSNSSG